MFLFSMIIIKPSYTRCLFMYCTLPRHMFFCFSLHAYRYIPGEIDTQTIGKWTGVCLHVRERARTVERKKERITEKKKTISPFENGRVPCLDRVIEISSFVCLFVSLVYIESPEPEKEKHACVCACVLNYVATWRVCVRAKKNEERRKTTMWWSCLTCGARGTIVKMTGGLIFFIWFFLPRHTRTDDGCT